MRYFSFASRCRIFNKITTGRRSVSYKTRKNFISVMSDITSQLTPEEGKKSAAVKNNQCSNFGVGVISNGAFGASSLFVNRDNANCIFNSGEGMQRLSVEHGFRLLRTRAVFLTHHSWRCIGGIMGLCLSAQSAGIQELVIYGPPHVKDMILGMRLFVLLKRVSLKIITDRPRHTYDDSLFKIKFVPIYPVSVKNANKTVSETNISHVSENDSDSDDFGSPSPKRRCHSEAREPVSVPEVYSLCYICETPEFGLHLDVEKCLSLGVPCGPLMGILKNKNNVKLADGKIIKWQDVCLGRGLKEFFIVVDCPGEEYLDSFVNESEFKPYQGSADNENVAAAVYHFTDEKVMEMPKYRAWMSRFPPKTKHIILNTGNRVLDHVESYRLQEKLNFVDPVIFPKLKEDNIPEVQDQFSGVYGKRVQVVTNEAEDPEDENNLMVAEYLLRSKLLKPGFNLLENMNGLEVIRAISTLRWKVYPKVRHEFSHSVHLDRKQCLHEMLDIENFLEDVKELKKAKERWEASSACEGLPEYPKILFLGTGSSAPQALRNTSAILLELETGYMILLDCGEGTYGQMVRFFGRDKVEDILKRLRLIYVSHQHADHHLGLPNLLRARYEVLSRCQKDEYKPETESPDFSHLLMILPGTVRDFIHSSNKFQNLMYDARIISSAAAVRSYNTLKRYTNNVGLMNLRTAQVMHTYESYAVTFSTLKGYRITYSGDTMPCDNLVDLGRDCDLLIHEATFEDGLEAMAKQKKHSTIGQALEIGKRMGAKFVMLTHFSQRYSHMPFLKSVLPENAGIAFDNMMVTPRSLPFLSKLEPIYKKIFSDKVDSLNNRSLKRVLREERQGIKASVGMNV